MKSKNLFQKMLSNNSCVNPKLLLKNKYQKKININKEKYRLSKLLKKLHSKFRFSQKKKKKECKKRRKKRRKKRKKERRKINLSTIILSR